MNMGPSVRQASVQVDSVALARSTPPPRMATAPAFERCNNVRSRSVGMGITILSFSLHARFRFFGV